MQAGDQTQSQGQSQGQLTESNLELHNREILAEQEVCRPFRSYMPFVFKNASN